MSLLQVEHRIEGGDYSSVHVLHQSRAEDPEAEWIPVEASTERRPQSKPASVPRGAPAQSSPPAGQTETIGTILLLIPLAGAALAWVGGLAPDMAIAGVVIACAVLIGVESSQLGMGKSGRRGDTGPVAWVLGTLLLWVIAYPWYLFARGKYGMKNLGVVGLLCTLFFVGAFFLSAPGAGFTQSSRNGDSMRDLNQSVTRDFIEQYQIVKRNGNEIEASVHAGLVAEAFLQQGNEGEYRKWKRVQEKHEANW